MRTVDATHLVNFHFKWTEIKCQVRPDVSSGNPVQTYSNKNQQGQTKPDNSKLKASDLIGFGGGKH